MLGGIKTSSEERAFRKLADSLRVLKRKADMKDGTWDLFQKAGLLAANFFKGYEVDIDDLVARVQEAIEAFKKAGAADEELIAALALAEKAALKLVADIKKRK